MAECQKTSTDFSVTAIWIAGKIIQGPLKTASSYQNNLRIVPEIQVVCGGNGQCGAGPLVLNYKSCADQRSECPICKHVLPGSSNSSIGHHRIIDTRE